MHGTACCTAAERALQRSATTAYNCSASLEVCDACVNFSGRDRFVLALVGWISFSKGPDRTSINIESDKIRQDTKQVMESGAQMLHKAGDEVEAEGGARSESSPRRNPDVAPVTR